MRAAAAPPNAYVLSWPRAPGALVYRLAESAGEGPWKTVAVGPETAATVAARAPGTYRYRVRGCTAPDRCGEPTAAVAVNVVDARRP